MSSAARAHLLDLTMLLHHETKLAVLVSDDGDKTNAVWLPKSQIEIEKKLRKERGLFIVDVTLPERLAIDKGLA
jgi:hypothetical protein